MSASAKARSLGRESFHASKQQMEILMQNDSNEMDCSNNNVQITPDYSMSSQIAGFFQNTMLSNSTDKLLKDVIMGTSLDQMSMSNNSLRNPPTETIQRQDATMNLSVDQNTGSAPSRRVLKGTSKDWYCSNGTLDFSMASLDWFSQGELPTAASLRNMKSEENLESSAIGTYPNFDHEHASLESSNDLQPTEHDVLSGRGTSINKHPGNISYRKIIDRCKPIYLELPTKEEKRQYSILVKKHIEDCGGRFLKKSLLGTWVIMDDNDARKKVSQSLREKK